MKEKVQYNNIFDREFIYQDRTPIIYKTIVKQDRLTSIVGGIDADQFGVNVGAGVVTGKNVVYLIKYNPANNGLGGAVYFPIFNFQKK